MEVRTKIEISEFSEEDRVILRHLYAEVKAETFHKLGKQNVDSNDFDEDTKGESVLVAKIDGNIAGFISVWLPDNFIHHLYVRKQDQRKGIGSELIESVKAQVNGTLTLKCVEDNVAAVQFYETNGWKIQSKGISENGSFILFQLNP